MSAVLHPNLDCLQELTGLAELAPVAKRREPRVPPDDCGVSRRHENCIHNHRRHYGCTLQRLLHVNSGTDRGPHDPLHLHRVDQRGGRKVLGQEANVSGFDGAPVHRLDLEHDGRRQLRFVHGCSGRSGPRLGCV